MSDPFELMDEAVEKGVFPGGVLLVSHRGSIITQYPCGETAYGSGVPVTLSTVYDLASLTKSLATAVVFMVLVQERRVDLKSRLGELLPTFKETAYCNVTVENLLTHTAGFPDYRPFYEQLRRLPYEQRWGWLKDALISVEPVASVDTRMVYSDIGYMVLAWLVWALTGSPIDTIVQNRIYGPLGISDLYYIRHRECIPERVYAPTEKCPWRDKVIVGEVHDDNAWVCGGVGGHAGLFGTAEGVWRILHEVLDVYVGNGASRVFDRSSVRPFLKEYQGFRRTAGFDMPSVKGSSSGTHFSSGSVGHLGFTGTSFWVDTESEVIVVLLTNRVHPVRDNLKIREFRPQLHDAVRIWLGK